MHFQDRTAAAQQLAAALKKYRDQPAIVYALPRGGVVLGTVLAKYLRAPLELVIPRKVGHPASPETAVCAVSETGYLLCNTLRQTVDERWLAQAVAAQIAEAKRRRAVYAGNQAAPSPVGKVAIIVDDGIATGLTIQVAIHDIKEQHPAKVVVAVPVAPSDMADHLAAAVDEFVALSVIPSRSFGAVGRYYKDFPQVSDEEVINLLRKSYHSP